MIPKRIIHSTHHKAGTVWFKRVLRGVASACGLKFANTTPGKSVVGADIVLDENSTIRGVLPDGYVGSHMVRDPRDMLVSAYFYHLKCREEWALRPLDKFGGKSFQQHLNALSQEDGIRCQIEQSNRSMFSSMREWDYSNPDILELRYEDCIGRDEETFEKLFRFYGFPDDWVAKGVEIAESQSLKSLTGREAGQDIADLSLVGRINAKARQAIRGWTSVHIRSGKAGQWQDVLSDENKAVADRAFGDLVAKLGYEPTR